MQQKHDEKRRRYVGDETKKEVGLQLEKRKERIYYFHMYHGKRPKILRSEDVRRILRRQGVKTLRTFFSSFFHMETQISRDPLVDHLMDCYKGKTPSFFKREAEMKNIDESYISSSTEFLSLCGISVPKDIMSEIFKYIYYDLSLLQTVGSVNSSFYLFILTTWSSWVPISHSSLFQISTLILKSLTRFYIGPGLGEEEYRYLCEKISPSRILEVDFHHRCKETEIRSFFNVVVTKEIVFSSIHTLHFPQLTKQTTRRRCNSTSNTNLVIPPANFPALKVVDHLQPMENGQLCIYPDLSRNRNIQSLVFGCKMFPVTNTSLPIYDPRDETRRASFVNVDGFHYPTQQICKKLLGGEADYDEEPFKFLSRLPDRGMNIRNLKFRIKNLYFDYRNFCRVVTCPHLKIHKLELIVDRLYQRFDKFPDDVNVRIPYGLRTSRSYRLTLDGKECLPESEFLFSQLALSNLKELKIQQKRIGPFGLFGSVETPDDHLDHLVGLFGPRSRFSSKSFTSLKIAKFSNVPLSICDSAIVKFTGLQIFHVTFVCGKINRHVVHYPKSELSLFFDRFVFGSWRERKFQWDKYFFYEEKMMEENGSKKVRKKENIAWWACKNDENPFGYEQPGEHAKKRNHKVRGWKDSMKIFRDGVNKKLNMLKKKEQSLGGSVKSRLMYDRLVNKM